VIVNQLAPLTAVHGHPAPVVTSIVPELPAAAAVPNPDGTAYVHPDGCVSVNVFPPIVSVPVRCGPAFAGTE
jgi:hypothetical protein